MASFSAFDILVLAMIALGAIAGAMRGFVTEVLSLLAWVGAFLAVRFLYAPVLPFLERITRSEAAASVATFLAIFVTAFILFRLVAQMLGDRTRSSVVGPVDRLLGFGFGGFKGLLGAALIVLLLQMALELVDEGGPPPAWMEAPRTGALLDVTTRTMADFIKDMRRPEAAAPARPAAPAGKEPGYTDDDRGALDRLLDRAGSAGAH